MPEYQCSSKGTHPLGEIDTNTGLCPHFDNGTCKLEVLKKCAARKTTYSDSEVRAMEHVEAPEEIAILENVIEQGIAGAEMPSNSLSSKIDLANSLIQKCTPERLWNIQTDGTFNHQAYEEMWNYSHNLPMIDFDMIQLSSLYASIALEAGFLRGKLAKAGRTIKVLEAAKVKLIRENIQNGVRLGKPSEKAVETELDLDLEYRQAQQLIGDAETQLNMADAMLGAITNHINVLKKRRDTLEREALATKFRTPQ